MNLMNFSEIISTNAKLPPTQLSPIIQFIFDSYICHFHRCTSTLELLQLSLNLKTKPMSSSTKNRRHLHSVSKRNVWNKITAYKLYKMAWYVKHTKITRGQVKSIYCVWHFLVKCDEYHVEKHFKLLMKLYTNEFEMSIEYFKLCTLHDIFKIYILIILKTSSATHTVKI